MANLSELPTVAEVLKHPSFPDATLNLLPTRKGLLPVAKNRGGPIKIGWEIHGEGPIRVVFIMGLGSFKSAWQRQTLFFGHEHYKQYSVLILDNRGMGDSDKPLMRYSTKEMARDVVEVLEHVGFLEPFPVGETPSVSSSESARCIHIVGISMGGMISQELGYMIPQHIASLSLCCTAAAIENTSPSIWANLANRAALIIPKGLEESVQSAALRLFPVEFLLQKDNMELPSPSTHLLGPPERHLHPGEAAPASADTDPWYRSFDLNYQRFVAQEMHKRLDPRFTSKGFLLQLIACGWHHKSPEQLAIIGAKVGRERIMVLHGTADEMISVPHGRKLIEHLQPGKAVIVEGMGHVPLVQRFAWYNNLLAERFQLGEKLSGR